MKLSDIEEYIQPIFHASNSRKSQIYFVIWAVFLFLGGAFLWGYFLNWGRGPFNFQDWAAINAPRLAFVRDALLKGQFPFHISDGMVLGNVTQRYLSVPDVLISPQMILLRFMEIGPFILLNTLLLYALGYWGLVKIRARFQLSALSFTLLFLLFNFNGQVLAHFTVGHITWWGYFLYSWLVLWAFELLEKGGSWRWVAKTSFLLFLILIQGSYHQFIWALMFIGLLGIAAIQHFSTLLKTAVFTIGLSLVRILPVALLLGKFDNTFIGGYPLTNSIWSALVNSASPNDLTNLGGMIRPVGQWELTLFVGFVATIFLIGAGIVVVMVKRSNLPYLPLLPASVGLIVLSMSRIYQYLRIAVPLPLFTGERISSRIILLAFVIIVLLAVIELQRWLDSSKTAAVRWIAVAGVLLIANDLWQNFRAWRIGSSYPNFQVRVLDLSHWQVANQYQDTPYFAMLGIGLLLSLISAGVLLWLVRREDRRFRPTEEEKKNSVR